MIDYGEYVRMRASTNHNTAIAEGYPCCLENSLGRHLANYKIYGNSSQEGTPTPSAPIDIVSVGTLITDPENENYGKYEISVITYGKNIANFLTNKMDSGVYPGAVTNNPDGSITVTAGANTYSTSINLRANSNVKFYFPETITISCPETTDSVQLHIVVTKSDSTKPTYILNDKTKSVTLSVLAGDMVRLFLNMPKGAILDNDTTYHPQIEYGEVATTYEKYITPITTNIYLDEPLRKIGEHSDYIDFKRKMVVRMIGEYNVPSSITWNSWQGTENGTRIMLTPKNKLYGRDITTLGFFNIGKTRQGGSDWGSGNNALNAYHSSSSCYWYPIYTEMGLTGSEDKDTANTILQDWLKNNDAYFTYVLANPTETKISLPIIPAQKGNVFIATNSSLPASNIYARYVTKP